jgi:hypothetical protein
MMNLAVIRKMSKKFIVFIINDNGENRLEKNNFLDSLQSVG